jgi:hypothetical protein
MIVIIIISVLLLLDYLFIVIFLYIFICGRRSLMKALKVPIAILQPSFVDLKIPLNFRKGV